MLAARHGGSRIVTKISMVISAVRYVLQQNCWDDAFAQASIQSDQTRVSSMVSHKLQLDCAPFVSDGRQTAEMIRSCCPRNRALHEVEVISLVPEYGVTSDVAITPATSSLTRAAKAVREKRLRSKATLN